MGKGMTKRHPRISIGLPVYNGDNYLEAALGSIVDQTLGDFELIISDNASTDRTAEICQTYAAQDRRIRYYRNEQNLGAMWNFNRVFALSSGEYFKWVAHDDLCAPDFLLKCVEALDRDPSVVLSYPQAIHIDEQGRFIKKHYDGLNAGSPLAHERFGSLIWMRHWCLSVFGVIRQDILRKVMPQGNYVGSDRVLLAELGLRGRFEEVTEELFLHREHAQRSTRALPRLQDRVAWFDPKRANRIVLPHWRLFWEYLAALERVPLARVERFRCHFQLIRWLRRYRKVLFGDLVMAADQCYRRLPPLRGRAAFR